MTFHPGRARKAEKNAHSSDPSIDRQYWAYVAADQLTDALAEIDRLRADSEQYERVIEARLDVIDQQAARIKELEADNQNLVTLNKSLMNNDWILRDNNRKYRKRAQKAEFLNKELKSKIGPEDAKPRSWQITEERKAAIQWASEMAGDCKAGDVLRGMLTEAGQ